MAPPAPITLSIPGDAAYQAQLYPPVALINPAIGLKTQADVIEHFTKSSLDADGIAIVDGSLSVADYDGSFTITFTPRAGYEQAATSFMSMLFRLFSTDVAGQAIAGATDCASVPGAWNPMAGYPVNKHDGPALWHLFLPLGMPVANHQSVTLMHYPPYVAMTGADYLQNMTLNRWRQILSTLGVPQPSLYTNIVDVNPIAAPGSGQSEYPNDYFPIMLSSVFFDDETNGRGYIRSMLELMLNPEHNSANPYTLPLLVCGSPLYDPQAVGWFRVRYKDQMPQDTNGIPRANVLQAGFIRLHPDSPKQTPYLIANHMIAAGVTGRCTTDPKEAIPDIRTYEAQDLVAATFVKLYTDDPRIQPQDALSQACQRWFGAPAPGGAPAPAAPGDQQIICALAQMDLFFDPVHVKPVLTWDEAKARCLTCKNAQGAMDPCCGDCAKPPQPVPAHAARAPVA